DSRPEPPPPGRDRRLPRPRHVPDDGRGPAPPPDGGGVPRQPRLGVPGPPPDPRRVDRLHPARPDPAVVLVPGRRGPAVLARRPGGAGAKLRGDGPARRLAGAGFGPAGRLPALAQGAADQLHLRGHALADRAGLLLPVPSRVRPAALAVGGVRGD